MSDLPEGVSESIFFNHPDGRVVELLGYRRRPDLSFGLPNLHRRRGKITHSGRLRRALVERDGDKCHYCESEMVMPMHGQAGGIRNNEVGDKLATLEHIVPRAVGGVNELYNFVLACMKCNNDYGDQFVKCECLFCQEARSIFRSSDEAKKFNV